MNGSIIVYIDDDCWVQEKWLKSLVEPLLLDAKLMAVTSATKIPRANFLGDCISALGFPGGGSLGFEKVWRVTSDGYTNHLAVGNCALRREVFEKIGRFDEEMKNGAEDAELSVRLERGGFPIKYVPEGFAFHEARTTWKSFVKWQIRRGRANYHFKRKVGSVVGFVKLRLWSAKNIFLANKFNWRLPFIFGLLGASFVLQQWGYWKEGNPHE
jgi:GT2 family glycosyltransferase